MREPAGIPTGGQFAATARAESDIELETAEETVMALLRERNVIDRHVARQSAKLARAMARKDFPDATTLLLTYDDQARTYAEEGQILNRRGTVVGLVNEVGEQRGLSLQDAISHFPQAPDVASPAALRWEKDPATGWITNRYDGYTVVDLDKV